MKGIIELPEFGEDYVYQTIHGRCKYVYDGEPHCLIGHVLITAGTLTLDELIRFENRSAFWICLDLGLPSELCNILDVAQAFQDVGETWGSAYNAALDEARNRYGLEIGME